MLSVLRNPHYQAILGRLYCASQAECTRNGHVGPEVGIAREKDLISVLALGLGDERVRWDLPEYAKEDVVVDGRAYSIKHISCKKPGFNGIKYCWTANAGSQEAELAGFRGFGHGLIVCMVSMGQRGVHLYVVEAEGLDSVYQETVEKEGLDGVFKKCKGNGRGIEFRAGFLKRVFSEYGQGVSWELGEYEGVDPVRRRMALHTVL